MTHGWVKIFSDNSRENGDDKLVAQGLASWSRGCLDAISTVILYNDFMSVSLSVPGTEWHQFDRYQLVASIGTTNNISTLIYSVIQAKILSQHVNLNICIDDESVVISKAGHGAIITDDLVGKWISVLVSKNGRYICIADKGTMRNVYKQISR